MAEKCTLQNLRTALVVSCALVAGSLANAQGQVTTPGTEVAVRTEISSLCEQVQKNQVLSVRYSYESASAAVREFHPYAVGYTKKKDVLLFGLQVKGYSKSAQAGESKIPDWRNFRVDRVRSIQTNGETFRPVRPDASELRAISQFICKNDTVMGRPS